jgi:hypothetical protein
MWQSAEYLLIRRLKRSLQRLSKRAYKGSENDRIGCNDTRSIATPHSPTERRSHYLAPNIDRND